MVELLGAYSNPDVPRGRLSQLLVAALTDKRVAVARRSRQPQRRLSKDDQGLVVQAYRAGRSVYDLAAEFGVNRHTVSAILERHDTPRRYNIADVGSVVRLYGQGLSLARVGELLGVNPSTVRNVLRKAGVATRPVGTNQWGASAEP